MWHKGRGSWVRGSRGIYSGLYGVYGDLQGILKRLSSNLKGLSGQRRLRAAADTASLDMPSPASFSAAVCLLQCRIA